MKIEYRERVFHLEVMRGGMNRLLLRSNRSATWPKRIEVLFMNVKYLAVGSTYEGLTVTQLIEWPDIPWRIDYLDGINCYEIRSSSGVGIVVAGSVTAAESEYDPGAPSGFFMMG